jgi:hypothetical protein
MLLVLLLVLVQIFTFDFLVCQSIHFVYFVLKRQH